MSELGKVWLLLGPETGEKSVFLEQLKTRVKKQAGAGLEESRYYPFETPAADIVSSLRNGSLFSDAKWVEIQQAETIKKEDAAILGEYLKAPAEDAVLILVSDSLQKDIARPVASGVPKDQVKIFWELFENQKQNWIRSFFQSRGVTPREGVVELILELVENNTRELKRECEKLILFLGEEKTLTAEEVEKYIYHSKEENVFTLFDRFAEGELVPVLEAARKISLTGDSHPVQLISGLLWQFRRLLELGILMEQRVPFEEACRTLGINGKRMQKVYRQGREKYSVRDMERIVALAVAADGQLRSGRGESQDFLMEMFFYYAVIRKGIRPVLPVRF